MAKTSRNKNKAANVKWTKTFVNETIGACYSGSARAMQRIAERGLDNLVNRVPTFSDYSGLMINSYNAVIIEKLSYAQRGGHKFGNTNKFQDAGRNIRFMTSWGLPGTTPVELAHKKDDYYMEIRKRRASDAENFRRDSPEDKAVKREAYRSRKGFGYDISAAIARSGRVQSGIEVVFSNPTPYAEHVTTENGHRVMPANSTITIMPPAMIVSITDREVQKNLHNMKSTKK